MAQREEGWPLGLQPLNARLMRNRDLSGGSVSFSTLLTGSLSSSTGFSSSDLDTQSTGSFYHDRSITLGSLIGISSIIELSRRSMRVRQSETQKDKRNGKIRPLWLFSLCSKLNDAADVVSTTSNNNNNNVAAAPSLGHFLVAERDANRRRNQEQSTNDISSMYEQNSLFINGQIAPQNEEAVGGRKSLGDLLEHGNGYGVPLFLSCLCVDNLIK